ncbi:MAG: hypothetical protein AAFQ95_19625 [Cyanobacteria bacterium J06621_3]
MISAIQKIGMTRLFSLVFISPLVLHLPGQAQTEILDEPQANSASDLQPTVAQSSEIAQRADEEKDDRINYIGLGGTIGLSDDGGSALGEGGFSILGRFSLTNNLSVHAASVISDDSVLSLALTGGAPIKNQETGRTIVYPFLGAGILAEIDDFEIDPLVSGGVDIPISDLVTGTARVNASFGNDGTDVGIVLGVGVDLIELF